MYEQAASTRSSKETIVALVENKPGVLNRVASLFRRRNFNVDSLTVGRTHKPHVSRMTIVVDVNRANAHLIAAINGGAHAAPAVAGDTVRAWSKVLDTSVTDDPHTGALRLRLVATKGAPGTLRDANGKYLPDVLLDLDYWALIPR